MNGNQNNSIDQQKWCLLILSVEFWQRWDHVDANGERGRQNISGKIQKCTQFPTIIRFLYTIIMMGH